jgi:hypothetical protein
LTFFALYVPLRLDSTKPLIRPYPTVEFIKTYEAARTISGLVYERFGFNVLFYSRRK